MLLTMNIKPKNQTPEPNKHSTAPSLSPQDVEQVTGGAITAGQLKNDRFEAGQNGTPPKIPFYRLGHRTVRYRPCDVWAYLETLRVE